MTGPHDLSGWAADYRKARRPSDALRERVLGAVADAERVDAAGALGHAGAANEGVAAPARQKQRWAFGFAVGALLGVAALLLLSLIVRTVRPRAESATPVVAPYERAAGSAERGTVRGSVRPGPIPPAQPRPDPPQGAAPPAPSLGSPKTQHPRPATHAEERADPAHGTAGNGATGPAPPATIEKPIATGDDLASLRRLRAAERTLGVDAKEARRLLEAHARDYPKSALAREREALWIRAACRSGGAPNLARRRAAFSTSPGVTAYAAAIRKDCESR